MNEEPAYWNRFWRRRLSRRRLLTGVALTGSGLATAAAFGCSSKTSDGPADERPDLGAEDVIDARRPFEAPPDGMTGGTIRFQGFDPVVLDRFDPHQTQFGPMYANLSSVFSKLYMYQSHSEPTHENILPDLASAAPERPEEEPLTYLVPLRQGVKFHDTPTIRQNFPAVAGRELTAEDIVFNYERQRDANQSVQKGYYYRRSQYETIDTIRAVDKYTVEIKTKEPVAPFYHFMADTNAMIIPKEIVDSDPRAELENRPWDSVDSNIGPTPAQRMIGTGPFLWGDLKFGLEYKASRNPAWFGWDDPDLGRPFLDGYTVSGSSLNDTSLESLFRKKEIDGSTFISNAEWIYDIKREKPELGFYFLWVSGWIGTRFKMHCKPFDDVRVRKAIHLATERQQVLDVIGSGEWKMQGPVGQAIETWALPYDELLKVPGYRQSPAEREEDITEARRLYDAAGRPEIPEIVFASLPDYIPNFIGTYKRFMSQNLGLSEDEIRITKEPYQRIAELLAEDTCDRGAMYFGFDNGWIDLDDWVFPYFHSTGSKNTFRLKDPDLDLLLEAQRREFDQEKRKALGDQIQRYLLGLEGDGMQTGAHARVDYSAPYLAIVTWPYVKNPVFFPWFGSSYWSANVWLDKNDPAFRNRPA